MDATPSLPHLIRRSGIVSSTPVAPRAIWSRLTKLES